MGVVPVQRYALASTVGCRLDKANNRQCKVSMSEDGGPDRKARQKRMRDVDVASVLLRVKRRARQVACVAVLVGSGPAQSQARDQLSPVLEPAACERVRVVVGTGREAT